MNPWWLLGLTLAWGASCWYAYDTGGDNRANAIGAQHAKDIEKAIANANQDAATDMQWASEWGARRVQAAKQGDQVVAAIAGDVVARPLPADCRLAPESLRVLNDAVRAANDLAPGAGRVPDAVPGAPGALERRGIDPPAVGRAAAGPSRPVPAPAR